MSSKPNCPNPRDPFSYRIVSEIGDIRVADLPQRPRAIFHRKPTAGMVVGTFAAVPYVHLQLESRRRNYPHAPLLIHDDGSPKQEEMRSLCQRYGADFETNVPRLPPCKGDITAFVGGLLWARRLGLDLVVKVSRRFLPRTDWTTSLIDVAMRSQYATYNAYTHTSNYGFRSECVGMAVNAWLDSPVFDEIIQCLMSDGTPFVEGFIHALARKLRDVNCPQAIAFDAEVGQRAPDRDGYAVWDFMGTDRCVEYEGFLWHEWSRPEHYHALSVKWGLPYSLEDFVDPNQGFGNMPEGY